MWTRNLVWVAVVVGLVAGCGSEEDDSNNAGVGGAGGAGGASGAGEGGASGAMAGTSGGTSGAGGMTGGMGGMAGFELPECSMEPGPAMCGTNACAPVEAGALCVKTCCTTDNQCGTTNLTNPMCISSVNDTMCPNETVGGQMVTGCCVMGTNECGITNIFPVGPPCVGRTNMLLAQFGAALDAKNCDGSPVMETDGGAGMGGAGGMMGEPDGGM